MSEIYTKGLETIRLIQAIQSPPLTAIIKAITFLGDPLCILFIIILIFWCINEKKGFQLGFVVLLNTQINLILKSIFKVARPYQLDQSIGIIKTAGFSTPSGHAQTSIVFYLMIVFLFYHSWQTSKNTLIQKTHRVLACTIGVLLPLLIGFSRVYLGVHFPTDIFLGWVIGLGITFSGIYGWKGGAALYEKLPQSIKILILAGLIFLLNALLPQERRLSAVLFGFAAGFIYIQRGQGFCAKSCALQKKIPRLFFGGIGISAIGFAIISIKIDPLVSFALCFILGLWITLIAPLLFIQTKLAEKYSIKSVVS
ncbi:MAG: phosphatase PAP2 family protein [Treponemataceae bacterium]